MEAGTCSFWVAKLVKELGHEAIVVPANAIAGPKRRRKNDRGDARRLMEVAWDKDRKQVAEVWQRPREYQEDLTVIRARDALMRSRSRLAHAVRGLVKPHGERLGKHSTESLPKHARLELSKPVLALVEPLLVAIEQLTQQMEAYDKQIAAILERRHGDAARLKQVHGVGQVTTSVYLAVIGDPQRFRRSRDAGAYAGLVSRLEQSGAADPQLGISKCGDALLRRVLVQCAQYILGRFGEDSDLRRWGLKLAGEGKNKARKRKAVVAVARKLAVLLHRLWITGETYEPLRNARLREKLQEKLQEEVAQAA
jgi:transposase